MSRATGLAIVVCVLLLTGCSLFRPPEGKAPVRTEPASTLQPAPEAGMAAPMPVAGPAPVIHEVKADDTLYSISMKYYGTANKWQIIQKANGGIDPAALRIGMKLNIPDASGMPMEAAVQPAPSGLDSHELAKLKAGAAVTSQPAAGTPPAEPRIYVVQKGDVLSRIAVKFYGDAKRQQDIIDANKITNPDKLLVGTKLVIP